MFCSNCGKELKANSHFCPNCGKVVNKKSHKTLYIVLGVLAGILVVCLTMVLSFKMLFGFYKTELLDTQESIVETEDQVTPDSNHEDEQEYEPEHDQEQEHTLEHAGELQDHVYDKIEHAFVDESQPQEQTSDSTYSAADYDQGYDIGMLFPDFTMTDANGQTVQLSDYRGKVLYLNFFTTWCTYCFYEIPDMEEIQAQYGKEVQVIMVDIGESAAETTAYADEYGISLPILHISDWKVGSHQIDGVPESFVLDSNGVIVDSMMGMAEYDWMDDAVSEAIAQ